VRLRLGGRPARGLLDRRAPFVAVVDRRRHRGSAHAHRVRAGIRLRGGRLVVRSRVLLICAAAPG